MKCNRKPSHGSGLFALTEIEVSRTRPCTIAHLNPERHRVVHTVLFPQWQPTTRYDFIVQFSSVYYYIITRLKARFHY